MTESKIVRTTPRAPTASAAGPCTTIIQISRITRCWKLTQHHRTTRPPQLNSRYKGVKAFSFVAPYSGGGRMVRWSWVNFQFRCGWGGVWTFLLCFSLSLLFLPLSGRRLRLKYCLKGPLNPKQPTSQKRFIVLLFQHNMALFLLCSIIAFVYRYHCARHILLQ